MSEARTPGEQVLWRKVPVPPEFTVTETVDIDGAPTTLTYGGDIRMGDLTGNGIVDFVVFRCVEGNKPCFIGAANVPVGNIDGQALWQIGEGGVWPVRPGPVAVYDIDSDGLCAVVCCFVDRTQPAQSVGWPSDSCANVRVLILDGRTGDVKRGAAPSALTESVAFLGGASRLQIGNFRGKASPRDLLICANAVYVALDEHLGHLWSYAFEPDWMQYGHRPAYVPALGDIDGDGRDEVANAAFAAATACLTTMACRCGRHALARIWIPLPSQSSNRASCARARVRAIGSGHGHVVDAAGHVVLTLGEDVVPHGQELRVGRLCEDESGQQMAIRCQGHHPDIIVVDRRGAVRYSFRINEVNNNTGLEIVYWDGLSRPGLLCNSDTLWRARGELAWQLDDLAEIPGNPERLRMSWHHCIPADVCGDDREEAALYNPWGAAVYIYTPAPLDPEAYWGYRATPRQYNVRLMN